MTPEKETSLIDEVGSRFDSIFGQDEEPDLESPVTKNPAEKVLQSPLRDIKSIVLSMDWEITDQALTSFGNEIENLKKIYSDNNIRIQLLKILQVVGNYIYKNQSGAHPTAFKLLHTVFDRFERVTLNEEMPQAEQQRLLQQSITDFTELKSLVSTRKISAEAIARLPKPDPAPAEPSPARPAATSEAHSTAAEPYEGLTPHEAFAVAVEEIKNMIRTEFQLIRAELRLWREGQ